MKEAQTMVYNVINMRRNNIFSAILYHSTLNISYDVFYDVPVGPHPDPRLQA